MTIRSIGLEQIACGECPTGLASGAGRGQFCPFIVRRFEEGRTLCRAGEPIDHVWFVKSGVVGLSHSRDGSGDAETLALPGSFVGLECMIGEERLVSARVLSTAEMCGASIYGFQQWVEGDPQRSSLIMEAVLIDPMLVGFAQRFAARLSWPAEWGPRPPDPMRR